MVDVRTLAQLQDALDRDMSWRVKEIGAFKVASKMNGGSHKYFIRAGISLAYAHWEGFIKNTSESYLSFVHFRGHTYRELKSCFSVFGLKGTLNSIAGSQQSTLNVSMIDFLISKMDTRANMQLSSAINTESNLTSKVFANIALSLGLSTDPYITKFNWIDVSLVKRRNKVAHGEYLDIEGQEFGELVDEVLMLMRSYKNDVENAASTESYKRTA
jgi:hypothetical protein